MNELKVFLNFRNGDAQQAAAHLYDSLIRRYEPQQIFRSSETIPKGDDYVKALIAAPALSDVTLSLIGPRWLEITDSQNRRRLDDPQDWVRREIRTALAAGRRVIPVLLDGAGRLTEDALPDDIAPIARHQHLRWESREVKGSFRNVCDELEALIPNLRKLPEKPAEGMRQENRPDNGSVVFAPMNGDNNIGDDFARPPAPARRRPQDLA